MKRPIRVGVLGCGYWGPLLIRNFHSLPDCRLKVVCDLDIARLKHACALYSDLEGVTTPERVIAADRCRRHCHRHSGKEPLRAG